MTPQQSAWYVTTEAIRKGQLLRPKACACGVTERIEAHHDDYAKPLEILWLCRKCHRARHDHRPPQPTPVELRRLLMENGGSVTQTAAEIGVHRVTIHKWMRDYGIAVQRIVAA
jgi:hypothetical protein